MELIYFISGILTAGIVYGANLLRHIKSSHTEILDKYQSQSNISSLRYSEMGEMIKEMKLYVNDIQDKLSKDSYTETTRLLGKIKDYSNELDDVRSKLNKDINMTEKSFNKVFSDIQSLKNQIKALGEDPNFLSRY
mgnify:FL=1|tara:strand:- start:100 stop:507 length:408 start_codon:yes stop_codon:yes gene_type:complete